MVEVSHPRGNPRREILRDFSNGMHRTQSMGCRRKFSAFNERTPALPVASAILG